MGTSTRDFFRHAGMPPGDLTSLPSSLKRFPDGAQYRIEIPSTEGPACLEAVLDEANQRGVRVHRVSQGSGVMLQTDDELKAMAQQARAARLEVSLATRPNAAWGTSAMARSSAGAAVGASARGQDEVAYQLQDARRAAAHGFRSVLITDIGTLSAFGQMRKAGLLPASMQVKISVLLPLANPFAARVAADLGASTINIPTDLTLPQIAAIRAAVDIPLDIYVESANEFGGFIRSYEVPELIRVAAPVYLKFGLRNAPDVYPSGLHVQATAFMLSRERVRRAQIVLELIARETPDALMSAGGGAAGLALVEAPNATWLAPDHAKEVLPLLVGD
ncbi:MAG TPA: U32 family peptidase [Candidatus Dormibacteraeota bacterium]|nr:U32 family peptidase [Candidatus Dormibacteraeota bacterium]